MREKGFAGGGAGSDPRGDGGGGGMTYSAVTVADEMLKIAKRRGMALTPMQLMKLVYIAHGWSLAMRGADLFKDRIEAWKYGPVIPLLYEMTKRYGREPIPLDRVEETPQVVDADTRRFLEDVFDKYGHLSGIALSNMTHQPGTPWERVYVEGVLNTEIPDEVIARHYRDKLDAAF